MQALSSKNELTEIMYPLPERTGKNPLTDGDKAGLLIWHEPC